MYVLKEGCNFRPASARCKVLAVSSSWIVNATTVQTLELWNGCSEHWASWLLTMFVHSLAYTFSVGWPNLKYFIFYVAHFSLVVAVKLVFGKLCFFEIMALCFHELSFVTFDLFLILYTFRSMFYCYFESFEVCITSGNFKFNRSFCFVLINKADM